MACLHWLRQGLPAAFSFEMASVSAAPRAALRRVRPADPRLCVRWLPLHAPGAPVEEAESDGRSQWGCLLPLPAAWGPLLRAAGRRAPAGQPSAPAGTRGCSTVGREFSTCLAPLPLGGRGGGGGLFALREGGGEGDDEEDDCDDGIGEPPAALEVLLATPAGLAVARITPELVLAALMHADRREVLAWPTAEGVASSGPGEGSSHWGASAGSGSEDCSGSVASMGGAAAGASEVCYAVGALHAAWRYTVTSPLARADGRREAPLAGSDAVEPLTRSADMWVLGCGCGCAGLVLWLGMCA